MNTATPLAEIHKVLQHQFSNDHAKRVRMDHFMNMLITATNGLSAMGVVLQIEVTAGVAGVAGLPAGVERTRQIDLINSVSSLDSAIKQVRGGG
jgi:hypothetical protein